MMYCKTLSASKDAVETSPNWNPFGAAQQPTPNATPPTRLWYVGVHDFVLLGKYSLKHTVPQDVFVQLFVP